MVCAQLQGWSMSSWLPSRAECTNGGMGWGWKGISLAGTLPVCGQLKPLLCSKLLQQRWHVAIPSTKWASNVSSWVCWEGLEHVNVSVLRGPGTRHCESVAQPWNRSLLVCSGVLERVTGSVLTSSATRHSKCVEESWNLSRCGEGSWNTFLWVRWGFLENISVSMSGTHHCECVKGSWNTSLWK